MVIKLSETAVEKKRREAAQLAIREYDAVDIPTAASAVGLAPRVIQEKVAEGGIPSFRIGRSIRIPTSYLRDLLMIEASEK
ncbi:excisionase [Microbacterium karelineae]|uniref:excisionase n=1 Tax=Microbacterium karelineae TaxID=2654283 RepID=UPI0012E9E622|nr:excisionase [Microbacterium karelineae]